MMAPELLSAEAPIQRLVCCLKRHCRNFRMGADKADKLCFGSEAAVIGPGHKGSFEISSCSSETVPGCSGGLVKPKHPVEILGVRSLAIGFGL